MKINPFFGHEKSPLEPLKDHIDSPSLMRIHSKNFIEPIINNFTDLDDQLQNEKIQQNKTRDPTQSRQGKINKSLIASLKELFKTNLKDTFSRKGSRTSSVQPSSRRVSDAQDFASRYKMTHNAQQNEDEVEIYQAVETQATERKQMLDKEAEDYEVEEEEEEAKMENDLYEPKQQGPQFTAPLKVDLDQVPEMLPEDLDFDRTASKTLTKSRPLKYRFMTYDQDGGM